MGGCIPDLGWEQSGGELIPAEGEIGYGLLERWRAGTKARREWRGVRVAVSSARDRIAGWLWFCRYLRYTKVRPHLGMHPFVHVALRGRAGMSRKGGEGREFATKVLHACFSAPDQSNLGEKRRRKNATMGMQHF